VRSDHRNANQRHLRQAGIGHQRIDAGAQVEDDAQIRKRRKLAVARLPDSGVVDFGRIEVPYRAAAERADPCTPQ